MAEDIDNVNEEQQRREMGLGEFDPNLKKPDANETEEEEETETEEDSVEEESEEEETDDSEDEDEEPETRRPGKGIPPKEFNRVRRESREKDAKIEELTQKLSELESKPSVTEEEIDAAAKDLAGEGAKPEVIQATKVSVKKILDLAWKGGRMSDAERKELATATNKLKELEDEKLFNSDWDTFEVKLEKQYPKATPAQIREARKAMDELAHAPQFADKEFDYVAFKNKDIFDEILSPRSKKTFESRETYIPPDADDGEKKEPTFEEMQEEAKKQDSWDVTSDGNTHQV